MGNLKNIVCASVLVLSAAGSASAVELITNGDFEQSGGSLGGWTVTNASSGDFFLSNSSATSTPNGLPLNTTGATGSFAVTDQTGPGVHILSQLFTVSGPVSGLTLNFDFFINDWSSAGPIVNAAGLDSSASPNQHSRVDILTAGADPFSTAAADIIATIALPLPQSNGTNPNAFSAFGAVDLSAAVLLAGGTFQLRFAEVDNQGNYNLGIDNVSLQTVSAVPLPAGLPLLLGALGFGGFAARRRSGKKASQPTA